MPKETRLWCRLTPVKAALVVFTRIGSKIQLVYVKSLPKFGFGAAHVFLIAAITLQQIKIIINTIIIKMIMIIVINSFTVGDSNSSKAN